MSEPGNPYDYLSNLPRQKTEAAFHLRRVRQLAPANPEVLQMVNEIGAQVGVDQKQKADKLQ